VRGKVALTQILPLQGRRSDRMSEGSDLSACYPERSEGSQFVEIAAGLCPCDDKVSKCNCWALFTLIPR
jgi:hypothetical protein